MLANTLTKSGLALILLGLASFGAFHSIGASIDQNGILREPFALLPIGFGLLLLGLLLIAAALLNIARRRWCAGGRAA